MAVCCEESLLVLTTAGFDVKLFVLGLSASWPPPSAPLSSAWFPARSTDREALSES